MTDSEIVKALECCKKKGSNSCKECPLYFLHSPECINILSKYALDLINRLQSKLDEAEDTIQFADKELKKAEAKNERLKEEVSKTRKKALLEASSKFAGHSDYHGDTILCKLICMAEGKEVKSARPLDKAQIKAEAYKEFAERLKMRAINRFNEWDEQEYPRSTNADIDNLLKELVGEGNA